jgi:hypothetical protein
MYVCVCVHGCDKKTDIRSMRSLLTQSFFLSLSHTHSLLNLFVFVFKGVAWIGETGYFESANEGDLDGGSRGWEIIDCSTR